jgi:hypothetical protein
MGHGLVEKELAALGEDKFGEGRGWMDDGAKGRGDELDKIRALERCNLMPVCQEEGAQGGEGATSDVRQWFVEEFLWV